jgi:hypothetical protein
MKTLCSLLLAFASIMPAHGQGKVNFQNNSLHLVFWVPGSGTTNAGRPYLFGDGGVSLAIELWAGTSSTSLSLQATTDFAGQSSPGTWVGRTVQMPSVPAGLDFFDIVIKDVGGGFIYASSGLFTAMASGGAAYYSLVQHISPAFSTWADGTYNLDSFMPGARGAIMLGPEPSTFALGCLGLTLLLLRRRAETRKIEK